MNEKIIIILIVVVVAIFVAFAGYFSTTEDVDVSQKEDAFSLSVERENVYIGNIFLTKREWGKDGSSLEFAPGDYMGIRAEFDIQDDLRISFQLLDEGGEVLEERFFPPLAYREFTMYHEPNEEIVRCCGYTPSDPGDYYIGIFIGEEKAGKVPFSVTETE